MAESTGTSTFTPDEHKLLVDALAAKLQFTVQQGKPEEQEAWRQKFLVNADGSARTIQDVAAELIDHSSITVTKDGKTEQKTIGDIIKNGDSLGEKIKGGLVDIFAKTTDWKQTLLKEIKDAKERQQQRKDHPEAPNYNSLAKDAMGRVDPEIRAKVAEELKKNIEKQAAEDAKKNGTKVEDERIGILVLLCVTNFDGKEYETLANQLIDNPDIKEHKIKQGFAKFAEIPDKDKIEKVKRAVGAAVDENTSDFTKSLGLDGASIMNLIMAFFDWIAGKGSFTECATNITASSIGDGVKSNLMKDGFSEAEAAQYAESTRKATLKDVKDIGTPIVAAPVVATGVATGNANTTPTGQTSSTTVDSNAQTGVTPAGGGKPNETTTQPIKTEAPTVTQNQSTAGTTTPAPAPPAVTPPPSPEAQNIVEKVVYNMMWEAEKERATDKSEQPNANNIDKAQLNEAVNVVMGVVSQDKYKNGLGDGTGLSKDIADAMLKNQTIGNNLRQKFDEKNTWGTATALNNFYIGDTVAKKNETIETGKLEFDYTVTVPVLGKENMHFNKGKPENGLLSKITVALNSDVTGVGTTTGNGKTDIQDLQAAMADFRKSCQATNNMECNPAKLGEFYSNTAGKQKLAEKSL